MRRTSAKSFWSPQLPGGSRPRSGRVRARFRNNMPNTEKKKFPTFGVKGWLLSIVAVWLVTAGLGRRTEPWAIELTNPAFAAALVWSYVAAWGAVVSRSSNRRDMSVKFVVFTFSMVASLFIVEAL